MLVESLTKNTVDLKGFVSCPWSWAKVACWRNWVPMAVTCRVAGAVESRPLIGIPGRCGGFGTCRYGAWR